MLSLRTADNRCGVVCHRRSWSSAHPAFKISGGVSGSSLVTRHCRRDFGHRTLVPVTHNSSLFHCFLNNPFSFHQHNGKTTVTTCLFNNIMERPVSDIFPPFVFNNIMEDTFIFPPAFFCCRASGNQLTGLISMT